MSKHRREPLYFKAKREIQRAITNGEIVKNGKLPSEACLAEMLSVSRATVRSALQLLKSDGIIYTRHGMGSYVNYIAAAGMRMRIDIAKGFFHLIMDSGYAPSIAEEAISEEQLSDEASHALLLDPAEHAYIVKRLFLGDGIPAFYVTEYIPLRYVNKMLYADHLPESVYQIAVKHCKEHISYSNMTIETSKCTDNLSKEMRLPETKTLLRLKEVHYTKSNKPLIFSDIFVNDDLIHFQVRRKID